MPRERIPSPVEEDGQVDSAVLALLVYGDSRPWSVDEVEREIGDDTEDGLARLYGAGLISRDGGRDQPVVPRAPRRPVGAWRSRRSCLKLSWCAKGDGIEAQYLSKLLKVLVVVMQDADRRIDIRR
jgi:hypothetical protein